MTDSSVPLASAASYVCPDSNLVLECKPLAELPWDQLGVSSPIVLVFVPQVLKEVDSKKQDGRIGKRAREFNRLLSQVTAQGGCLRLPNQDRDVYLAIGRSKRIDWANYDDEDPDDGDSRVVLEVLNLADIPGDKVVFVSNDVKPIWIAKRYNINAYHAGDEWRRPIEPSPHDKDMQRLKQRVAELETSQPKLALDVAASLTGFKRYAVRPLSAEARDEVIDGLRDRHPRLENRSPNLPPRQWLGLDDGTVTPKAYREFEEKLAGFVDQLPSHLEQQHGQFPFTLTVKNTGPLRAQNLVLSVTCSSGWLNERPVVMPTRGPSPEETRRYPPHGLINHIRPVVHLRGRHEMDLHEPPKRSPFMRVQCEDFPSGETWTFKGYACVNPRVAQPMRIRAQITASNLHGMIDLEKSFVFDSAEADVSDLLNLKTLKHKIDPQSWLEIHEHWTAERYDAVELFDAGED